MFTLLEETTYTPMPGPAFSNIQPTLDEQGISYAVLKGIDIPDEYQGPVSFAGRVYDDFVVCIKSNIDSRELKEYAERVSFPWKYENK